MGNRSDWKLSKRDGNRHVALPHVVLESSAYRGLQHAAKGLLIDIAMQYNGRNNGRLVACKTYLGPLGWNSSDTITRAKQSLLDCGLLIETRKGACPNKVAWYALAWYTLDQVEDTDITVAFFRKEKLRYLQSPVPIAGAKRSRIGPMNGAEAKTQHRESVQ